MSEVLNIEKSDVLKALEDNKVVVTELDKENFFKCFLADKPYREAIPLFGGKMKLTFRSLTMAENNLVFAEIKKDQTEGIAADDDAYFIKIQTYRVGLSLVEIDGSTFQEELTGAAIALMEEKTSLVKLRAKIFDTWPIFKFTAVMDAFRQFENKVLKLTTEVRDQSFWQAAKLTS